MIAHYPFCFEQNKTTLENQQVTKSAAKTTHCFSTVEDYKKSCLKKSADAIVFIVFIVFLLLRSASAQIIQTFQLL